MAAQAGVSKGGLLYHFRTKEALLQAMVGRRCAGFEARTREQIDATGRPVGALAAYVAVALNRKTERSVAGALTAAIANDTKLLQPMREHLARWLPQLEMAINSRTKTGTFPSCRDVRYSRIRAGWSLLVLEKPATICRQSQPC